MVRSASRASAVCVAVARASVDSTGAHFGRAFGLFRPWWAFCDLAHWAFLITNSIASRDEFNVLCISRTTDNNINEFKPL